MVGGTVTTGLDARRVMEAAAIMRQLHPLIVKDKTYRKFPIGAEAGRFLTAMEWEGAARNTLDSYETVCAHLTIDHADLPGLARFCAPDGVSMLRDFLQRRWADSATATKAHRVAVLKRLFKWAVDEGVCPYNPTSDLRSPRVRSRERSAYPRDTIIRLVLAQESLRDQCALQLLARMGLRKNELRLMQIRDIDLGRKLLTVHGKGGKTIVLPLGYQDLADDLYLHIQGGQRGGDEYLLYPKNDPGRPMDSSSLHRWFKRCLENAGLPTTIEMHELRHTAADDLFRLTGNIVIAQMLLRHESVGTTQIYLHPTREDLAAAMRLAEIAWQETASG